MRSKTCAVQNQGITLIEIVVLNAIAHCVLLGSKGVTAVRALASHQCGPCSNPGVKALCGLSLLLVLSLATRGFSVGTPVFPSP